MRRTILIGIGNPGARYARTFHNAGALFTSWLVARHGGAWNAAERPRHAALPDWHGIVVGETGTYMNESGEDVAALLRWLKPGDARVIVAHDDTDQSLGAAKLVEGGGAGGHRGVISVHQRVGEDVARLKIGARPERFSGSPHVKAERFVLEQMTDDELALLERGFAEAERLLERFLG